MKIAPVNFTWRAVDLVDGDGVAARAWAMVPQPRYDNVAKRQFADGETYTLQPVEERSMASHRQYFAAINDAWHNLPERLFYLTDKDGKFRLDEHDQKIVRWPTPEHFRKDLLIMANWCDVKEFPMPTHERALELGKWIRPEAEYAKIEIVGNMVVVKRAKSQSLAAMKKQAFEDSRRDVLALAEAMTGTPVKTMMKEAGRSA
jgi:hypothetical protein